MVIVDGEETYSGIGLLLEKRGHRVIEAVNDSQALEAVKRERPEVILMDTDLPPARSLVVARGLRERSRLNGAAVVVVVTPHRLARTEGESLRVAPDDYVVRQGDFEQLKNILDSLSAEAAALVANGAGGK
jgi:DNA-binding response OmpR family regulator